jgi:two-component system LytT family response regulator
VIRVLIVDDEPAARGAIRTLLAADPEVDVVGESADGRAALDAIRAFRPELVFLDVQMPELDGLALLRQLAPDEVPVVVFTTAYDAYAIRAFELQAVDYLLKPFDDARFLAALARAKERVRHGWLGALSRQVVDLLGGGAEPAGETAAGGRYLTRLVAKARGRVTVVPVRDIDWLEADGDHVQVHSGRTRHVLRETLKQLGAQLDPRRFIRIHRSTIVNVDRIKELQPYFRGEYVVLLHDGTSLKLSRGCKPVLEAALGRRF